MGRRRRRRDVPGETGEDDTNISRVSEPRQSRGQSAGHLTTSRAGERVLEPGAEEGDGTPSKFNYRTVNECRAAR